MKFGVRKLIESRIKKDKDYRISKKRIRANNKKLDQQINRFEYFLFQYVPKVYGKGLTSSYFVSFEFKFTNKQAAKWIEIIKLDNKLRQRIEERGFKEIQVSDDPILKIEFFYYFN